MIQFVCDFDALLYSSLASGITEIRKSWQSGLFY